ncbi:MAG TPA: peptide chain release factor N(5)-glutamine methyltransferase [bacterium]|nr:peptide chain release factor N(5)-glutamine methyltransferase [bacterium]
MEDKVPESWTPLRILQWAVPFLAQKGLSNPRLDAEVLVAHALGIKRLQVYLQYDRPLDKEELARMRCLFQRRAQHEPIQYITGIREFYGLAFYVAPGVLIPRPETELLVERALTHLKTLPEEKRLVLDLGTGSGCIALAIAKTLSCRVWGVDRSEKALELAVSNATKLEVPGVIWRLGSWFDALKAEDPTRFGVIVSNPPYIPFEEKQGLAPEVRDFEPPEALFAENKGLGAYQEIQKDLMDHLDPDGAAFFELEANGYDKVRGLFGTEWEMSPYSDLQGITRVLGLFPRQKS